MGVVYKAKQLSLDRVVALKMLRDNALAGSDQFHRFSSEAGWVARLQHPNIVQVYDRYEHEGRPYFAMEFVGGGSLAARLAGKPLPPDEAAGLVETLARAVHHAHQQGIIHRDLKPANILLQQSEGAGGRGLPEKPSGSSPAPASSPLTPKITDFGLAKNLAAGKDTTTAGVMGTPSYMAPEQASGLTKDVGPATDVYALGAILYECLTGRPPFEGDNLVQTLDQVRFQEPKPVTQLSPEVPPDLESVCMRCLRKEPERRYTSAAALAEDLQRFLEGKPVSTEESPGDSVNISGYEVWEEVARGGIWIVCKARDLRAKRLVALKRVRAGSPLGPEHLTRLRATIDIARQLDHPNIPTLFDAGGSGPRLYLAVELIEGGSLARKTAGRPFVPNESARLVEVLARAVQHAHERGLVHCHLQPANVLLDVPETAEGLSPVEARLGVPKIIGFEMARRHPAAEWLDLDAIRPMSSAMAPEQLFSRSDQIGPATDLYSLGVILYELLTGRPPYQATTTAELLLKVGFEILQPPHRMTAGVPVVLSKICMKCLEERPQERYHSAAELADELKAFQEGKLKPPPLRQRFVEWVRGLLPGR
jgi:serine/threonine protein kinase